jgi:hypoxanthine phosphoribosyltransferase
MNDLNEIARVEREADRLYSEAEVEAAIERIAGQISARLADKNPLLLTVLNGGIVFAAKLMMRLRFPLEIDAINASRYRGETRGSLIHWLLKPALAVTGRTVLIIDDILDEGVTLAEIVKYCKEQGASAVYTCVLVDKRIGAPKPCHADFVALEAENRYLFGYGMDYKSYLRNAPGIFACKQA